MSVTQIPTFEINFDLPPEERYLQVFVSFDEKIKAMFQKFYQFIPKARREFFDKLALYLKKNDNDYYKELECLSNIIDFPIEKCIAVDHVGEATTGCTSIIAKVIDQETGQAKIIHGRNLDYPVDVPAMREVLYKGIFTKGGKEICTNLIFAGFQGTYTTIKKGEFSISYNVRMKKEKDGFMKSMILAFSGYKKWSRIIHEAAMNCETFEEAVEYLQDTPSINGCYLTVCGTYKGVKITRDRFKSRLNWVYADAEQGEQWFDVQTNCDCWEEPPKRDNGRKLTAEEMIKVTGVENLNEQRMLYNVLHIDPVGNKETVYCSFMDPSTYRCTVLIPDDYA